MNDATPMNDSATPGNVSPSVFHSRSETPLSKKSGSATPHPYNDSKDDEESLTIQKVSKNSDSFAKTKDKDSFSDSKKSSKEEYVETV